MSLASLFGVVDINSATATDLLELNGIGKAKAAKIIKYRVENSCFKSIDDLANIEGISKNLVEKNRVELTLGACQEVVKKSTSNQNSLKRSRVRDLLLTKF